MNDNKYAEGIRKTGFVLEYKVANTLRQAGWTVISNKYYEDDFEGSVREIDLLAYKVSKVQQVDVYTTLLISCKKVIPIFGLYLLETSTLKIQMLTGGLCTHGAMTKLSHLKLQNPQFQKLP